MTEQDQKFIAKVKSMCVEEGECWIWQGPVSDSGYPVVQRNRKKSTTRRYVWEAVHGLKLTPRDQVRAKCDNKLCVCPGCAYRQDVAVARKQLGAEGRYSTPRLKASRSVTARRNAKLDLDKVAQIKNSDESTGALVERFQVHRSLIRRIKNGQAWKDHSNPFAGLLAANDSGRRRA